MTWYKLICVGLILIILLFLRLQTDCTAIHFLFINLLCIGCLVVFLLFSLGYRLYVFISDKRSLPALTLAFFAK
jgi:hypothetical protein